MDNEQQCTLLYQYRLRLDHTPVLSIIIHQN